METENNIGEIFRETFKDFERKPSDNVWKNIESKAKAPTIQNKFIKNRTNIIIGSAAIIIVATIAYYLFNQTNNNSLNTIKTVIVNNTNNIQSLKTESNTINNIKNNDQPVSNNVDHNNTDHNTVKELLKSGDTVVSTNNQKQNTFILKQEENIDKTTNTNPITTIQKTNNNNPNTSNIQKIQPNISNNITHNTIIIDNTPISFTPDQTICNGDKVKLEVTGGSTYLWSTGDKTQYIIVSPAKTTDYSVIVTDSKGVIKSGLMTVTVADCELITVPNAFAPNGSSGQAKIFKAYGNNISNFEMLIYTRAGQIVFTSKNIDEGWNGYFNGNLAPMGVYVYRISYIDQLNTPHTKNGSVTLIR